MTQALGGPPADWVKSILKNGRALLLLDGIDEIPNAHREATRRSIVELVNQYPETYFVVSTRPKAVDPNWLISLGFHEARINPLSDLDRTRFIARWHEAVGDELKARGKAATDLAETAASLTRELEKNPEVARLATNPLLCAMICGLYRDRRQKLPERQRQLCEDLCHALLHRRERESGLNLDGFQSLTAAWIIPRSELRYRNWPTIWCSTNTSRSRHRRCKNRLEKRSSSSPATRLATPPSSPSL